MVTLLTYIPEVFSSILRRDTVILGAFPHSLTALSNADTTQPELLAASLNKYKTIN
jgi:hypothetical protein